MFNVTSALHCIISSAYRRRMARQHSTPVCKPSSCLSTSMDVSMLHSGARFRRAFATFGVVGEAGSPHPDACGCAGGMHCDIAAAPLPQVWVENTSRIGVGVRVPRCSRARALAPHGCSFPAVRDMSPCCRRCGALRSRMSDTGVFQRRPWVWAGWPSSLRSSSAATQGFVRPHRSEAVLAQAHGPVRLARLGGVVEDQLDVARFTRTYLAWLLGCEAGAA